jgi:radical SAM protein with 4Fe4S-binding SPASM domain
MEIVRYANVNYLHILGEAPVNANKVYRLSKCLLMADVNGGKVILNGLTRAIVFLTEEDFEELGDIFKYSFLYKTYFLVPEDFDELGAIDDIRKRITIPIDSLYLERCNSYTILTTYGCNARCEYCYEKSVKSRLPMSKETAKKVANYIINKSLGEENINLHWFGGEPLFNAKVIDVITSQIRDNGRNFVSTMTTNGYLFDEKLITKAINSWHLQEVQITLDGTETKYNKIKNYVYKNSNAFNKVMNNIGLLLNNGVRVMIRLNISEDNKEDLYDLVNKLYDTFGVTTGLEIYCWPLFMTDDVQRPKEDEALIYEWIDKIENRMMECGFPFGKGIYETIRTSLCMADSGWSILVAPDGKLGTCEHFVDSKFWGDVNDPGKKDYDVLNTWRIYEKRIPECENCPIYGDCVRPSECMEMKRCNELIKNHKVKQHTEGLINYYLEYKRRSANESILNVNV